MFKAESLLAPSAKEISHPPSLLSAERIPTSSYLTPLLAASFLGSSFPYGTLLVNGAGSFLIGLLAFFFTQHFPSPLASAFLVTGFLGGLTTFSSMMNEIMQFFLAGHLLEGCAYLLSQLLIGLLAVFAGYLLMSRISL